jgi:predicted dienelactone hydrolase
MTPSAEWLRPRFAVQWWRPLPRLGAAAAILGAVCLVARAQPAQAGIEQAKVVGTGTAESCAEAALDAALAGGGLVTFDCGPDPVTITITSTKVMDADTTIDGGSLITVSGGNSVGVFSVNAGVRFTVENLTIANAKSANGGGINNSGTLTVTNSTVSGNSSEGDIKVGGSGISNVGTATVTNSTVSGNSSAHGLGGIANWGSSLTVTNSTVSGNSAGGAGGGIVNFGTLTVTNSTVSGNSARDYGGIVNLYEGTVTITNTIVANSTSGGNCAGTITDGGHNLDSDGTCGVGPATDPLLDPAGLRDHGGPTQTIALLSGSPAINAGDPEVCANPPVNGFDQRGFVRPGVGHTVCSIGAYEADAIPSAGCTGDCDGNGVVAINELILGVNIVLGTQPVDACPAFSNSQGMVDIAQLIKGVNSALNGCPREPADPTQPGPFGVGVRQITFTKPSETRPGEERVLRTDVWYPTAAGATPVDPALGGVVDAPLADGARALPLVLYSHGSCSFSEESRFLTTALASYGFIVVAPPHPGNVLGDPFCFQPGAVFESILNRAPDIMFVIDALLQLNAEPTSFLHDAIDPSRIGVAGHSLGGQTALRVAADDPRLIAVLALAPAVNPSPVQLAIPVMVQGGALDSVTPFATNARAEYDVLGPPRYLVEIQRTGHHAFNDDCYPGSPCDAAGPDALTQAQAHRYVLRYAVPFLLHWVASDDRFDSFLAPAAAPAGVTFTADIGGE